MASARADADSATGERGSSKIQQSYTRRKSKSEGWGWWVHPDRRRRRNKGGKGGGLREQLASEFG